jgi:hypothetical protein
LAGRTDWGLWRGRKAGRRAALRHGRGPFRRGEDEPLDYDWRGRGCRRRSRDAAPSRRRCLIANGGRIGNGARYWRVPKANQSRCDAATITLFGGGGVVPVWSFPRSIPAFSAARPSNRTRYHGMYRCGIATQLTPAATGECARGDPRIIALRQALFSKKTKPRCSRRSKFVKGRLPHAQPAHKMSVLAVS